MKRYQIGLKIFRPVGRVLRAIGVSPRAPVFIVGTGRCGTTLLKRILRSHRELAIFPGEANYLWHPKQWPELGIPPIEVDPKRFTEVSLAGWPRGHLDKVRDTFLGFHVIKGGSKVPIVKSAALSYMMPKLLEIYPEARFLHIFRYGPPVVESYMKKNFRGSIKHRFEEREYRLFCARYWNDCILEIGRISASLKSDVFHELSYEALCSRPVQSLRDIARFLRVDPKFFEFDVAEISSTNHKVGDICKEDIWHDALDVMLAGMKLKGYTT